MQRVKILDWRGMEKVRGKLGKSNRMRLPKNVLGETLEACCSKLATGYFRDGLCRTGQGDFGMHIVCAIMTEEFLEFTFEQGNDLVTPNPDYDFPGLKPGDRWCLCVTRWREALEQGVAPKVVLAATHMSALEFVSLEELQANAWQTESEP